LRCERTVAVSLEIREEDRGERGGGCASNSGPTQLNKA